MYDISQKQYQQFKQTYIHVHLPYTWFWTKSLANIMSLAFPTTLQMLLEY